MAGLQHNFPGGANGLSPLLPFVSEDGNIRRMEEIEAEAIRFAMQYYHGRMTEVARRLGIGRSTLYRKLSEITVRPAEAA
jgi:DNA-binding NtrC family response regulator